jgi:hypothetical protein
LEVPPGQRFPTVRNVLLYICALLICADLLLGHKSMVSKVLGGVGLLLTAALVAHDVRRVIQGRQHHSSN